MTEDTPYLQLCKCGHSLATGRGTYSEEVWVQKLSEESDCSLRLELLLRHSVGGGPVRTRESAQSPLHSSVENNVVLSQTM